MCYPALGSPVLGEGMRAALVIAFCLISFCGNAHGALTVCNDTGHKLQAAIAYKSTTSDSTDWISEGWWSIDGGDCKVVMSGDLTNRYIYLYAESDYKKRTGPYDFCVSNTSFTIHGADANCEARGYQTYQFDENDTGDATDWKITLSD